MEDVSAGVGRDMLTSMSYMMALEGCEVRTVERGQAHVCLSPAFLVLTDAVIRSSKDQLKSSLNLSLGKKRH